MRALIVAFTLFPATALFGQGTSFFDAADAFFAQYVQHERVNYAAVHADPSDLDALVAQIAAFDLTGGSPEVEKAFYINAYNVLAIQAVIEAYPVASALDVNGFFDAERYTVAGARFSLDALERGRIFERFPDPRLHFVLVCAAEGCPAITPQAYRPASVEQQIERRTHEILNQPQHIQVDDARQTVRVSALFDWYRPEFTADGQSILAYINRYRTTSIPTSYAIDFLEYDWALNDARQTAASAQDEPTNLQAFTPGALFAKGQYEVKVFNNLYTQTAFYDANRDRVDTDRWTFFTGIISSTLGLNRRLNLGVDFYFKSVRRDTPESSPFSVFQFNSDVQSQTALAAIAPKVRFAPFAGQQVPTFQAAVVIPVANDLEGTESGRPFLDYDDPQVWLSAFYDYRFNTQWLLYLETGLYFRKDTAEINPVNEWLYPLKALLHFYPTDRWTLYLSTEYNGSSNDAFYTQLGLGAKYQLTPGFELEALATTFPAGRNKGAGQTLNFGFRFIR